MTKIEKEIINQNEQAKKNARTIWTLNNGVHIKEYVHTYFDCTTAVITFYGDCWWTQGNVLFGKATLARKIGYYYKHK